MTVEVYKQLAQGQISNSATAVYTVPAASQGIIKHLVVVNPTVSDCWVKIWTTGSTDSDLILPQVTIGDGEWAEFDGTITLAVGETIVAQAQTASALTITVHGIELLN